MKILIYGAGVIGGQLAHALCRAGNAVTVIARGSWGKTLREEGLRIHHCVQRRDTTDPLRVLERPDGEHYDLVFAVMQYRQMERILPELASLDTPAVVLTGNNLSPCEMEQRILAESPSPKTVLFAFGSTAGTRENGRLTTVHLGDGRLTVGRAKGELSGEEKALILTAVRGSRLSVAFTDEMEAWLLYHAAFILPVVYLCYKTGCDLKRSNREDRRLLLEAAREAYHLLMELGYPVRPEGDEKTLEPGLYRLGASFVIWLVSRTRIGALCTTEHCLHAPGEMEDLDRAFGKIRERRPDFPMPSFDRLRGEMPAWEEVLRVLG